ncbi:MAG: sugar transferase, partial [Lachnospiraceae bacterium]|nr:sugar transferase [Lachnospiraceae bacterium]
MKRLESLKKISVLWLSYVILLIQTGIYAYIWLEYYYPILNDFNRRLKYYRNGHILIIAIYFILLFFFTNTYGGLKFGYLKSMDIFLSQAFALLFVNIITYFQLSLMHNWLVPVDWFAGATLLQ